MKHFFQLVLLFATIICLDIINSSQTAHEIYGTTNHTFSNATLVLRDNNFDIIGVYNCLDYSTLWDNTYIHGISIAGVYQMKFTITLYDTLQFAKLRIWWSNTSLATNDDSKIRYKDVSSSTSSHTVWRKIHSANYTSINSAGASYFGFDFTDEASSNDIFTNEFDIDIRFNVPSTVPISSDTEFSSMQFWASYPTISPTNIPTGEPTTSSPTSPTLIPSIHPSKHPSIPPTIMPTNIPTTVPTAYPSMAPTFPQYLQQTYHVVVVVGIVPVIIITIVNLNIH